MTGPRNADFLRLYKPIHDSFIKYCDTKSYGLIDTEDLVQEAVLITLEQFDKLKDQDKILSYMIGIANNVCRNLIRKRTAARKFHPEDATKLYSKAVDPITQLEIEQLYVALSHLPEPQKEAIILFEINGFSMKEVSEIQGSSVGATKTRISRGRDRLRKIMTEQTPKRKIALSYFFSLLA